MNIVFFSVWNAIKVYRQWVPCGRNSSYSFPPIVLKHCRCFQHGMKMCMWFWYNTSIIFSHFFFFVNLVFFFYMKYYQSVGATPRTVFHWLFWNFADVFCMEWRYACGLGTVLWICFLTFSALWTSLFFFTCNAIKVYRQWVPCGRNSSYSFLPIVLKICRCFQHGMKMCMWFWYNTLIIFSHFFCVPCGCNSSYSFALIVLKLCRCFLHGMKMCMWFWYHPWIFIFLSLSSFQLLIGLSPQIAL